MKGKIKRDGLISINIPTMSWVMSTWNKLLRQKCTILVPNIIQSFILHNICEAFTETKQIFSIFTVGFKMYWNCGWMTIGTQPNDTENDEI